MAPDNASSTKKELPMYDFTLSHEVNEARFVEYKAEIQRLYDVGKPLFTKEAIRDLFKQLEAPRKGRETIRNNKYINYMVKRYDDVEVERIYAEPEIAEYQEEETVSRARSEDSPEEDSESFEDDDNTERAEDEIRNEDGELVLYDNAEAESFEEMMRRAEDDIISVNSKDEYVSGPPIIGYHRIQDLLSKRTYSLSSDGTGCTLGVLNISERLDRTTNKLLMPKLRGYQDAVKLFEADLSNWGSSNACQKLENILSSAALPTDIRKIVSFSTGSAMHAKYSMRDIHRSNYQHAVILTLREILGARGGKSSIACFAQDPAYKEGDKDLLKSKGVSILSGPDGFLEVDEFSVVVSCASNVPVKQIICDLARPAIMIWDRDDGETEEDLMRANMTDPYSPRLRNVIDCHYDTYDFPGDRRLFGSMSIFIRRNQEQKIQDTGTQTGSRL